VFASTFSATVPLAFPLCPDAIAIQAASLVALQVHPASVETSNERRPPAGSTASPVRLSV
jgi:hypothetical protein